MSADPTIRTEAARMAHEQRGDAPHPVAREAANLARRGLLDRRRFLRIAALLGVSGAAAGATAYRFFGPPAHAEGSAASLAASAAGAPRPGGRLVCAMDVQPVGDPALSEWVERSNQLRHQYEYLTITGADNITRPMLAASWAASDDLMTWTFTLREGVYWRSGAPLTAEDVAFNLARWLDPALGSSNASLFAALTPAGAGEQSGSGVEIVDPLTLRLHLKAPTLAVPESFYNYPTAIVPPDFSGDPVQDQNGTGPYQLVENIAGEQSVSRRVQPDGWRYWGEAAPHVGPGWIDEIVYRHAEPGDATAMKALERGDVDIVHYVGEDEAAFADRIPGVRLAAVDSALTGCLRMSTTTPPFDDWRVRRAVQLCCDVEPYPDRLFGGRGRSAAHHHVAPIHPEYFDLPAPERDIAAAKRLLTVAGYPSGIDLEILVGNTSGRWQQRTCEILRDQVADAGVRLKVSPVSPDEYQKVWKTTPFGFTQWIHRPLGTMALALGYRSGAPWNESGFASPEFDAALAEAEARLDITARREAMGKVQEILQDAAVMVQPVWAPVFLLARERVNGLEPQPSQYHQFNRVWLDA